MPSRAHKNGCLAQVLSKCWSRCGINSPVHSSTMEFDLDRGLSGPVDGIIPPHSIPALEESEALVEPGPAPGPPGRPPNAHQNYDLQPQAPPDALQQPLQDLIEFQRQEREIFGLEPFLNFAIERLGPEDPMDFSDESDLDSEDQSIDLLDPEDETNMDLDSGDDVSMEDPNLRVSPDSQVTQQLDQGQHQHRLIAENPLEVVVQVYLDQTVEQVQDCEIQAAGAGDLSMESIQVDSPTGAAALAQAMDHDRLARPEDRPPLEEKFTTELSTQIRHPPNSSSNETVALTAAASPSPASHLPNASGDDIATDLTICDSNLEILPARGGVDGARTISDVDASVKTKAADVESANILEDYHRSIN